ncbi:hypothetical protein HYALB_00008553 [Hymenoscyphus albidus]|uniref:Uncharacterized protein n=1 Tax=Hymenoscyphus albidus TaxID=595503 RepID=A0A9N9LKG9_9HELO|nr:hypothetical protein HYALB_00008553 [Hymenoscyphus albidus]
MEYRDEAQVFKEVRGRYLLGHYSALESRIIWTSCFRMKECNGRKLEGEQYDLLSVGQRRLKRYINQESPSWDCNVIAGVYYVFLVIFVIGEIEVDPIYQRLFLLSLAGIILSWVKLASLKPSRARRIRKRYMEAVSLETLNKSDSMDMEKCECEIYNYTWMKLSPEDQDAAIEDAIDYWATLENTKAKDKRLLDRNQAQKARIRPPIAPIHAQDRKTQESKKPSSKKRHSKRIKHNAQQAKTQRNQNPKF